MNKKFTGAILQAFTFDEFMREDPEVVSMIGALLKDFPDRIVLGATTYGLWQGKDGTKISGILI